MEAQIEGRAGGGPILGEAVHDAAGRLGALLAHQSQRVGGGGASVHDQRQARAARGADMGAKAFALPLDVALGAEIVEAGLADRHHLRVRRETDQRIDVGFGRVLVVGMHADRGAEPIVAQRQLEHLVEFRQRDAHAQRVPDPVVRHFGEHLLQATGKVGKIEVTV